MLVQDSKYRHIQILSPMDESTRQPLKACDIVQWRFHSSNSPRPPTSVIHPLHRSLKTLFLLLRRHLPPHLVHIPLIRRFNAASQRPSPFTGRFEKKHIVVQIRPSPMPYDPQYVACLKGGFTPFFRVSQCADEVNFVSSRHSAPRV